MSRVAVVGREVQRLGGDGTWGLNGLSLRDWGVGLGNGDRRLGSGVEGMVYGTGHGVR